MVFPSLSELIAELRGRFGDAGRSNDLTVDVGERFANDDSNNNQSDEQHAVHPSRNEKRKDIIDEENVGDCAIDYGYARLGAEVSLEARRYNGDHERTHTTLRVPTRTSDGVLLFWTISEIKLAAIPIMAIKDPACRILTTLKVPPTAP